MHSILTQDGLHEEVSSLYDLICDNFRVTHIALNAPIPHTITARSSLHQSPNSLLNSSTLEPVRSTSTNILRSPTGLTPIYGNFGPSLPLTHTPTATDFTSAFWCTAQQNGIFQTWTPRYTMFSRGNISEKARVLKLDSPSETTLGTKPQNTSPVDLYAGIGYFAFSYAKAGVGKVLCWEINPWSVEGLRRGAARNKWGVSTVHQGESLTVPEGDRQRLIVFQESNEHAAQRIHTIRDTLPPVSHVNCGFLPSSKDSWDIAVQILDPVGGWIHAHENIAKTDIGRRKEEVVDLFKDLVERYRGGKKRESKCVVEYGHVELVKSYAPGVWHCILDIVVGPSG